MALVSLIVTMLKNDKK
ncbi:hypothetical protein [Enterococcus hirae]